MTKYIDLLGKKFNKLKILRRLKNSKAGKTRWLCKCECGNTSEVVGSALTSNSIKTCGCVDGLDIKTRIKKNIMINENNCWILENYYLNRGYGCIKYRGKNHIAHRLIYEIYKGEIPKGIYVCHKCDNPSCVNPEHLFLGTPKDNSKDMTNKGRQVKGEKVKKSILKSNDIIEIKKRLHNNENCAHIGRLFNVHRNTILNIKKNRTWKHIS